MSLSIVIPTLNEASELAALLASLKPMQDAGARILIADGGSTDGTVAEAMGLVEVVNAPRGRARQMNQGAACTEGDWLLFLHADTRLPGDAPALMEAVERSAAAQWGFFPVRLSGGSLLLRLVEQTMNWRSRYSRIATGDQAIFIRRRLFEDLGGFSDIPLMEDIELCKRLKKRAHPVIFNRSVVTSSRRWEQKGILCTIFTMWALRAAYACGAKPGWLVKYYYKRAAK